MNEIERLGALLLLALFLGPLMAWALIGTISEACQTFRAATYEAQAIKHYQQKAREQEQEQ